MSPSSSQRFQFVRSEDQEPSHSRAGKTSKDANPSLPHVSYIWPSSTFVSRQTSAGRKTAPERSRRLQRCVLLLTKVLGKELAESCCDGAALIRFHERSDDEAGSYCRRANVGAFGGCFQVAIRSYASDHPDATCGRRTKCHQPLRRTRASAADGESPSGVASD